MSVVLHIGFHKTGSSAIQEFLHEHRDFAREKGIGYPKPLCIFPSHAEIAWSHLKDWAPWRDRDYEPIEVLDYYRAIVENNEADGRHTVISNEDISLLADDREMFHGFAEAVKPLNPIILAYVRDPSDYVFSAYHHAIAEGHTKSAFKDWYLTDFHADAVDFRTRVERWEMEFGAASILIREYGANGTDSVGDFLSIFGVDRPTNETQKRVNTGIHPWFVDSYRKIQNGPPGETSRQALIRASVEAPVVDAAEFYLRDDAAKFKARYRNPYNVFMKYVGAHYRTSL